MVSLLSLLPLLTLLEGIVDEVLGTLNLLQMILGVIEGQIRGGYFPDCILDPSVIDPTVPESVL